MTADDAASSLGSTFSKRSRSFLLLVDADFQVVLGEDEAFKLLGAYIAVDAKGRAQLTTRLCSLMRERTRALTGKSNTAIGLGQLLLRLIPMKGSLGKF